MYPQEVEYAAFTTPEMEQDISEPLPTPRFAIPHYPSESEYGSHVVEDPEQDVGVPHARAPRVSALHSRTPSLLARSESVRTELTYLTAQDSRPGSRRISNLPTIETPRSYNLETPGQADGDTTLVDPQPEKRPSPVARLKASFESLLQRTRSGNPSSIRLASLSHMKWLTYVYSNVKDRVPWKENERGRKPAELLFWAGFIAPWCWLIGGWMLARSGEMVTEGLPRGVREDSGLRTPHTGSTLEFSLQQQQQKEPKKTSTPPLAPLRAAHVPAWSVDGYDLEKGQQQQQQHVIHGTERDDRSTWDAMKSSSAELLASLRGDYDATPGSHQTNFDRGSMRGKANLKALRLRADAMERPEAYYVQRSLDRWVIRCRVAAVASGLVILVLLIIALIVLARAL
jgi:hypothetical protein